MIAEVFAAYMLCAPMKFENKTDKWTDRDVAIMTELKEKKCRELDPNNPCLFSFEKTGEAEYNVMCGPPQPKKW